MRWMTVFQDHLCNDPTEGFFTAKPTQLCCFRPLGVYTNPPPPVLPFESLLPLNHYPKEIAGSDMITNHTMYARAFKAA